MIEVPLEAVKQLACPNRYPLLLSHQCASLYLINAPPSLYLINASPSLYLINAPPSISSMPLPRDVSSDRCFFRAG